MPWDGYIHGVIGLYLLQLLHVLTGNIAPWQVFADPKSILGML